MYIIKGRSIDDTVWLSLHYGVVCWNSSMIDATAFENRADADNTAKQYIAQHSRVGRVQVVELEQ